MNRRIRALLTIPVAAVVLAGCGVSREPEAREVPHAELVLPGPVSPP